MKPVQSFVVAALVAVPAFSFAQTAQPLTRAQVKAELVQLQQAGYNAAADNTQYPANLQAALTRESADSNANKSAAVSSGYGGVAQGASASGQHESAHVAAHANDQDVVGLGPIYAHS